METESEEHTAATAGCAPPVCSALRIEQPDSVDGDRWFFRRGWSGGFGAWPAE